MSQPSRDAADYISRLGLIPHPEGGFYRETYRAAYRVNPQDDAAPFTPGTPPASLSSTTSSVTSIHYLLQGDDYSGFHRIAYPELWYFHDGAPLTVHEIDAAGSYRARTLGRGPDHHLSFAVEPGTWFAAELPGKSGFALVSCAVAPAFDFAKFEMAKRAQMIARYPAHADILARLCRD
jgi:predicted cupin superfamily sugar epimerase